MGKSPAAVVKAIGSGRLVEAVSLGPQGHPLIDPEAGRAEWARNTRARVTDAGETVTAWREARARREAALASLAEDELRKGRGELVEAAGVERRLVETFSQCRTKLMGIPSRLKQRCPHLGFGDLAEIEAAIREALEGLAEGVTRAA